MSSSNQQVPDQVVVLGMHADDTLNVYVRDAKHNLHQAARITTRNGVDPMAMTTIMADLTEAFGWRQIVASPPEGPHSSRELPRGTRPAVNSAAAPAGREPKTKATPLKRKVGGQPGTRRGPAEMRRQSDTILAYLDEFDAEHAVTTQNVVKYLAMVLHLNAETADSNIRNNLKALADDGKIGRIVDPTVLSGGRPRHRWYGIRVVRDAPVVDAGVGGIPTSASTWEP